MMFLMLLMMRSVENIFIDLINRSFSPSFPHDWVRRGVDWESMGESVGKAATFDVALVNCKSIASQLGSQS